MGERDSGLSDAARVALGAETRVQILLLCERGHWSASELAAELGGKRQTMLYHLHALEEAGLIEEASRVPIAGGPLISYRSRKRGWLALIAEINRHSDAEAPEPGA